MIASQWGEGVAAQISTRSFNPAPSTCHPVALRNRVPGAFVCCAPSSTPSAHARTFRPRAARVLQDAYRARLAESAARRLRAAPASP